MAQFLNPFLMFTSFFLIVPKCDMKSRKISTSKIRGATTVIVSVLLTASISYSLYKRDELLYTFYKNKMLIMLDIARDCFGLFWFLLTCVDEYIHRETWNKFLDLINDMKIYPIIEEHVSVWKSVFIQLLLFNMLFICIIIATILTWMMNDLQPLSTFLYTRFILLYLEGLIFLVSVNFIYLIKNKYKEINHTFNNQCMQCIQITKKSYCLMDKVVHTFNQLFGKHLFYLYLIVGIHFLNNSSRVVHEALGTLYTKNFGPALIIKSVLCIFVALFEVVALSLCCSGAAEESQKLLDTCYKLQERCRVHSNEYRALENLIHLIVFKRVKFTAAGIFEVNRSSMFALVSGAASYLIVVLQSQYSM